MDDTSYAFINQKYVISQSNGADSGIIDVTAYIRNGLNKFTFITYNGYDGYAWGFEIIKNGEIIFDDMQGLADNIAAYDDYSEEYEIVYNKTISINITKCTTVTSTPSTDDVSYAFINQKYVTAQQYGADSGFIDVTPYIKNGLNKFTFLTYNDGNGYNWGFEIMKNGEVVFDDMQGLAGAFPAYDDYSEEYEIVYNKTISMNITKCTTVTSTPSSGCINDMCSILLYNIDDASYAFINQQHVASQRAGMDSGFIDASPYVKNGLNKFTFITYNGYDGYAWGFKIMKNGEIIFDDMQGLAGAFAAYNDYSKENQIVYNKTISINITKCTTVTSTPSTGCNNDLCSIRLFNTDDTSYAFINQQYVTNQRLNTDSGFIDVSPYIRNGLNKFTFLTYNENIGYAWGYKIMKNNAIIFDDTQVLLGADALNDISKEYQFVHNNTVSINITKCTTVTSTPSTGCINDMYSIRLYNADDSSYAFINQKYVTAQRYGADSGFIDVTPYIKNGLNKFTFLTYNVDQRYGWGFEIMKNGDIVFEDTEGLSSITAAYDDYSTYNQFVYNKTISINATKCTTVTSTPSTVTGCMNDMYSIRVFNSDDVSYAFVNQYYVTRQLSYIDSDFIDVTPYIKNGLNKFTFLTYNNGDGYTWGFEIMKNGDIIFDDMEGLVGAIEAYNDNSKEKQIVYNKTISINITNCTTMTSIASTYETTVGLITTPIVEGTTSIQQQMTSVPQQTTSIQQQTTSVLQHTTSMQQQTTSAPLQATSVQQQTASMQQQMTSTQQPFTSIQQQTTLIPQQTISMQEQSTSVLLQTTLLEQSTGSVLTQSTTLQHQSTAVEYQSISLQQESTSILEETTSVQSKPITMTTMSLITLSKVSIVNQNCFAPVIFLIPSSSSLISPMQFRRNQDFFISTYIQLKCNNSLATIMKWTVKNCTSACLFRTELDQSVVTTASELYIPASTLPIGIYELALTVTMIAAPELTSSVSAYVKITSSGIVANLVPLGTSMVTRGYQQNLTLDPGSYSVDSDGNVFNASDWNYEYYCRIYGIYNFPNNLGILLSIDDPTIDPLNPSCLSNQSNNSIQFSPLKSSITLLPKLLLFNQTFEFMVWMKNRRNSSIQATGYVLVQVDNTYPQMIAVACVISTMCIPNLEFQLVNPTTQLALFSICLGTCTTLENITWNIYQGFSNGSFKGVQWNQFNQTNQYENILFFGIHTSNFTAMKTLFIDNPQITYWRFEVVYSFSSTISTSALNFFINQPPVNGSCFINPLNGTTSTLFNISCPNWFDEDDIKDYSFYLWTTDRSNLLTIGFTSVSNFQLRLPAGSGNESLVNLVVYIRDTFDCITEYNLSSLHVLPDTNDINDFIDNLNLSSSTNNNNPILQLLATGNQNFVGQIIISLSQIFNEMNIENVKNAVLGGVPSTSIFISPLGSPRFSSTSDMLNESTLLEFNKKLNIQANIRDYLISFTTNLIIANSDSIKLQASALAQLTQATNGLTRNAITIASNKCYQLSMSLYSMATRIPYEDVYTASVAIAECITNVITAVNGPLQGRIDTLDLDFSQANTLPQDYDTDLESEWSNLKLFANGNDFSSETIEQNRNIYYQKQLANQITNQATQTISLLTSALNIHLNIDQNMTLNSSSIFFSLQTISSESLADKLIEYTENAYIRIPSTFNTNTTVSIQAIMEPLAITDELNSQSHTNLSRSISLKILHQNGNEISIETNITHPIELIIPRDPNLVMPPMSFQDVISTNSTSHNQLFHLHYINITNTLSNSIHFEIHPLDINAGYLFIYKFDSSPQLNSSIDQIDGWALFCPSNLTNDSIYTYSINNQKTVDHQSIIFGLRELNATEIINVCMNSSITSPPITNERYNFTSNYELRVYASGCYYLNTNNTWQSDGLIVGNLTDYQQTQCFSPHLATFAGGFIILPSPINWKYVFANAEFLKNKTVYFIIISICIIYVLLVIYAHHQDKKDLEMLQITLMPDNYPLDEYFYQIIVFTGHRKSSGTKSKVHFILSGDNDITKVRTLDDPHRSILQRSGTDTFLMTTSKSLGILNRIHIWHDNTGQGGSASWFLKYIIIRDLQTMEKFDFICERWLAVEKDDGKIERVLYVANDDERQKFSHVLSKHTYYSMTNNHLWFSIFSRLRVNRFTRVQRCTCCFVLFYISIFLNIMYYGISNETKNTASLTLGPFYISSQQIIIGIMTELLALLPSLLLVQLFQRLKPRQNLYAVKHSKFTFPWWFIFIAYGLSLLLVILSIFFIIVRGIELGDLKTQKWLTSIIAGFFSSIFLTQPMKKKRFFHFHRCIRFKRLNEAEVNCARLKRLKELQMWSTIREMIIYTSFLLVLCVITYSHRDQNSFRQVDHLRKFLLNTKQINYDYTKISTIDQYWNWLENSFISNLRAQQWYNNEIPRNLSGFINDKSNRLIGWATMRQLRIKSTLCPTHRIISHCQDDYSLLNEETRSFQPGWINETTQIYPSFTYQSSKELDTYVYVGDHGIYDGSGYVYEFRGSLSDLQSNLSQLHQLRWIDSQTRAVIIQISLYNPNVQLFTSVILLTEFLSTGGIIPQSQIEPFSFRLVFASTFQLICAIFYIIFILYFMFIEIQSLFRLKRAYFQQFWSYIEVGIIICSWTAVGIYYWRYQEFNRIGKLFKQTNGYVYINFQFAAYVDCILTFLFGFCCFFGTIKFLHVCRYNQHLSLFSQTLQHASQRLIPFCSMFAFIYLAFVCLFYLLFVSHISTCSSMLKTAQMLFQMTLLKFDSNNFIQASSFLGPFCFSIFIFFVVFICLSMFISIVNDSFRQVRNNIRHDEDIFLFTLRKFLHWTGLKKSTDEEIRVEQDTIMRSNYFHAVEHLPEKIDQLFDALNRVFSFMFLFLTLC
ncbi:unnamed protein product [Adineta steineri]|uniref:PLAT domain-containing protein n=2 Tax=Adineta steineri TaxID=433720 RepID=A0A815B1H8_9BILA|nr:unnamed protein product [Adineta steineri]